jgi:hypothetical protein
MMEGARTRESGRRCAVSHGRRVIESSAFWLKKHRRPSRSRSGPSGRKGEKKKRRKIDARNFRNLSLRVFHRRGILSSCAHALSEKASASPEARFNSPTGNSRKMYVNARRTRATSISRFRADLARLRQPQIVLILHFGASLSELIEIFVVRTARQGLASVDEARATASRAVLSRGGAIFNEQAGSSSPLSWP